MWTWAISVERLVENDSFVGDHYAYSACSGWQRLVNDELRSSEQIERSWIVDSFMHKKVERGGANDDAGKRFRGNLSQPVQITCIYPGQAVTSLADPTALSERLIAVAATS